MHKSAAESWMYNPLSEIALIKLLLFIIFRLFITGGSVLSGRGVYSPFWVLCEINENRDKKSEKKLISCFQKNNENIYFWTNLQIFGPILSKPEISQKIQLGRLGHF